MLSLRRLTYLTRLLVCLGIMTICLARAWSAPPDKDLTIEEVVKLAKAGFSEDLIITKIKKNGKPYDLSTDELLDLKRAGVSDNVIRYLLDPSQPYTPPQPAPAPAASATAPASAANNPLKKYPPDALASRVPPDPGLYLFVADAPVRSDLKLLLGTEKGKTLMKKGKTIAYLVGPEAKVKTTQTTPTLYLRMPDGHEIQELVLVALDQKNGRREVQLGPGPKQELDAEAMCQFDSLEVGPRLFRLTPAKLEEGEYLFFFLGSVDPSKGIFGKAYDFGVYGLAPKK